MTVMERKILGPLLRKIRIQNPDTWHTLKYQTQNYPYSSDFPHYPAALDLEQSAAEAIAGLEQSQKQELLQQWRSCSRLIHLESDSDILRQYGFVLLDYLVSTAETAAARSQDLEC